VSATWTAQWIYLTAPFLGAALAAIIYRWLRLTSQRSTDGGLK
jgi:glycerol uptake facilitator-like aquaporin